MNTERTWRKSTYSNSESACVELSMSATDTAVRDTKDRDGGTLMFSARAFAEFVSAAKTTQ